MNINVNGMMNVNNFMESAYQGNDISELITQNNAMISNEYISIVATNEDTVQRQGTIPFDRVDSSGGNISFNRSNNTITFGAKGIYFVSWWISVTPIQIQEYASSLLNGENLSKASSFFKVLVGVETPRISMKTNALIKISQGEILRLTNSSNGSFRMNSENRFSGQIIFNRLSEGRG